MRRKLPGIRAGLGVWHAFAVAALGLSLASSLRTSAAAEKSSAGIASWYGEAHRGKLMANGKPFDPDLKTGASWFFPLGTKVRVTLNSSNRQPRSVVVIITDRGPARRFVNAGRIIDLSHAAFRQLADPDLGLVDVSVEPVEKPVRL